MHTYAHVNISIYSIESLQQTWWMAAKDMICFYINEFYPLHKLFNAVIFPTISLWLNQLSFSSIVSTLLKYFNMQHAFSMNLEQPGRAAVELYILTCDPKNCLRSGLMKSNPPEVAKDMRNLWGFFPIKNSIHNLTKNTFHSSRVTEKNT